MDISRLSHGAKLVLAGTIVFLVVSIFNWQEVDLAGIATAGASMWNGWGWLAGLTAVALVVWEGLRLANISVTLPTGPAITSAFLAILLVLFTFLKFVTDNEFRTFWAWLGLLLAIAVVVGAVMNMQAAGESVASVREQLGAAAAAATGGAAARSATSETAAASAGTAETGGRGTSEAPQDEAPEAAETAAADAPSASSAETAVDPAAGGADVDDAADPADVGPGDAPPQD
jgi:hypothetical protein